MPEQLVQQAELQSQLLAQEGAEAGDLVEAQRRAAKKESNKASKEAKKKTAPAVKGKGKDTATDDAVRWEQVPPGFQGERRSFTATIPGCDSRATVLWYDASIYVKKSRGLQEPEIKIDQKGGSTMSVRKHGGWTAAWKLAQKCG
ncbi:unnamed protein product, partial [Symbiodinium sp. CCMP2456]